MKIINLIIRVLQKLDNKKNYDYKNKIFKIYEEVVFKALGHIGFYCNNNVLLLKIDIMNEISIVRQNLMTIQGYTGYCGSALCKPRTRYSPERWPRTVFNGDQFVCPKCNWVSEYPIDFITRYKKKWNIKS